MNDSCPCKGCNDRTPYPNCHSTCEKYKDWKKDHEERKADDRRRKLLEDDITGYSIKKQEKIKKVRKSIKWSGKR